MFYFNITITILCIWAIMWLNNRYLWPALVNKYRFELFSLRDDLAVLSMNGSIEEEDKDYKLLMGLLNSSINALSDFSITHFLSYMYEITTNAKLQKDLERFTNDLEKHKNEDLAGIAKECFEVNYNAFLLHTKFFRTTFIPVSAFLFWPVLVFAKYARRKNADGFVERFSQKKQEYEIIDSRLDALRHLQPAQVA